MVLKIHCPCLSIQYILAWLAIQSNDPSLIQKNENIYILPYKYMNNIFLLSINFLNNHNGIQ